MTTQTPEQKLSRRDFLKLSGAGMAGLAALKGLGSGFKTASAAARAAL
jgi:anaerobic selenocysteine-containing dehydrogenase